MKTWYVPTWQGDLSLTASPDDKNKSVLSIVDPTAEEKNAVAGLSGILIDRGWLNKAVTDIVEGDQIVIDAPLEECGPVIIAALRPGPAVLTAIRLRGGQVEVVEHSEPGKATEKELKKLAAKPASAAVTVRRPTPSCPDCFVEAIAPATRVLLAFLTSDQHETWAKDRYILCQGGLTGHRYIVAHRSSEIAAKNGRICWDADDQDTLHFHDQSVPPEEEVLAAMLCLQHREPWLRNEATCLGVRFHRVFKNPFGDHLDGVADATFTKVVGMTATALLGDG
jgi:hypothetical protein